MPFTPFHLGPGCAVKAVLGRHFSLTVFAFSQVVIDIEPFVRILRGDAIKHGFTHTYFGAAVLGVFSLVVGRPLGRWFLRWWPSTDPGVLLNWLRCPSEISWTAAATGAFIGTFSHVLIDSVMHADMQPLAPFAEGNRLLWLVSPEVLHLICVGAGFVGLVGLAVRATVVRQRTGRGAQ